MEDIKEAIEMGNKKRTKSDKLAYMGRTGRKILPYQHKL